MTDQAFKGLPTFSLALRLLFSCGLLLWLAHACGREIVSLLLPAFQAILGLLDDHYRILSLALSSEGADSVVRLTVTLAKPIFLNGHVAMPHPQGIANVSIPVGSILQIPLICLGLLLAWPAKTVKEYPLRLVTGVVLTIVVMALDTPFALWANLWDIHVQSFDPERFSPLLIWQKFLLGGGRLAIGIAFGVVAIVLAKRRVLPKGKSG